VRTHFGQRPQFRIRPAVMSKLERSRSRQTRSASHAGGHSEIAFTFARRSVSDPSFRISTVLLFRSVGMKL
jgi:hypothetical protein